MRYRMYQESPLSTVYTSAGGKMYTLSMLEGFVQQFSVSRFGLTCHANGNDRLNKILFTDFSDEQTQNLNQNVLVFIQKT